MQINANAKVMTAPDTITMLVPIGASAATAAAARAANQTKVDRVKAALAAKGIGPTMVSMIPPTAQFGFIGNAAYGDGEEALPAAAMAAMERKSAQSTMKIVATRQDQIDAVRGVLDAEDLAMIGAPVPELRDDTSARSTATGNAVEQARRDAESYARPLGLKVARIARVANYGDQRLNVDWQNAAATMQQMFMGGSTNREVVTNVSVWIDFVLAPR